MTNSNWFEEIIGRYSELFTQKLHELLKSVNDLGGNSTHLLSQVLTDPNVSQQSIEEVINQLTQINQTGAIPQQVSTSEITTDLKAKIEDFSTADSQLDILNKLIVSASNFSKRVALFIISGERTIGWLAWGFVDSSAGEISRKKLEVPYSANSFVFKVKDSAQIFQGQPESHADNSKLFQDLGGIYPNEIACIPLITKNRVSGVLYLDQGGDATTIGDISHLELEVMIAGMVIDLIPLRKSLAQKEEPKPSPTAIPTTPSAGLPFQTQPQATPTQDTAAPLPFMQPQTPTPFATPQPEEQQPVTPSAAEPEKPSPFVTPTQPQQVSPPEAEQGLPMFSVSPEPPTQQEQPAFVSTQNIPEPEASTPKTGTFGLNAQQIGMESEPEAVSPIGFQISDQQINPPAQSSNVAQFPGATSAEPPAENRQAHDEAKRFARLLILEIKLYNEDKVMEGRKNKNLYSLLKEEIDRSNEVYNERTSPEVAKTTDYFKEELISILAGGDTTALGI